MSWFIVSNKEKVPILKSRLIDWLYSKGEKNVHIILNDWISLNKFDQIREEINEYMRHDMKCDFFHVDVTNNSIVHLIEGNIVYGNTSIKKGTTKQEINRFKLIHPERYKFIKTYFRLEIVDNDDV